eukprot:TRINITY_DN95119_c0_g1_i1.p1 TRINITY_DN95119_c0_g1~~TRINITY_DN95119_c0_g1_i1.p1  ORF type:complete len:570 (+),score=107.59 TRINITY_DN95119_c0_g1_i1:62-1771(+)
MAAEDMLTVVIFGATGDLARKKLFPALYELLYGCPDAPLLPKMTQIVGYGRAAMKFEDFVAKQCINVKGRDREAFLQRISYVQGQYDQEMDFEKLNEHILSLEHGTVTASRLFFLSVPPTVFGCVCQNVNKKVRAITGFTRIVIEKPFGRDSRSFAELNNITSAAFREDQLYRIDHYLAKEKVLNLIAFRFANQLYEPLWNRQHISQVEIVFKEDFGTNGRGGYFDNFGIIRDIMQNHLLQVLLWLAMEPPEHLDSQSIAVEKLKLLKAIPTLKLKDCLLGQYTSSSSIDGDSNKKVEPGYLDDSTVPAGSRCPTYAAAVLNIDNERWRGVPFLMRAGKGLDERLAEVRITFKKQTYNKLIQEAEPNELVLRIQPDEGIYLKCSNKRPGWNQDNIAPVHLNMSYKDTFPGSYVAGAYERTLLNAAKGDQSLFVGSEELTEAWRIFTPLLDEIDSLQPQPELYAFGSTAPEGLKSFALARGIQLEALESSSPQKSKTEVSITRLVATPVRSHAAAGCDPMSDVKTEKPQVLQVDKAQQLKRLQVDTSADGSDLASTPPRKWRRLKSHGTF